MASGGDNSKYVYLHKDSSQRQALLQQLFRHSSALAFVKSGILDRASANDTDQPFNLLEIGCGFGWTTQDAARMLPRESRITAIDANEELIQEAKNILAKQEDSDINDKIEFETMSGEEAASKYTEGFDAVWIRFVVVHIPDPNKLIRAARDCLKPGGILLVEEPDVLGGISDPPIFAIDLLYKAQMEAMAQQKGGDLRRGYQIGRFMTEVGGLENINCDSFVPLLGKGLNIPPWMGVDESPLGKWPSQEELFNIAIPFLQNNVNTLEPKLLQMKTCTVEDMEQCRASLDRVSELDYQVFTCRIAKVFQWWATKSV